MDGMLPGFEGQMPNMADFQDHITAAFPEVRLKRFLEMRGADGGAWGNICALPTPLGSALLYDESLAAAADLASGLTANDVSGGAAVGVARVGLRGQLVQARRKRSTSSRPSLSSLASDRFASACADR